MCFACKTEEEFLESVDNLREELKANDFQFSPRIFLVGEIDKLIGFYVVTAKLQFKLPSFLRCVDLVVKLKFALNYNFPESCELLWCFIAKYFYKINYTRKVTNSQLLQLFAFLENRETTA